MVPDFQLQVGIISDTALTQVMYMYMHAAVSHNGNSASEWSHCVGGVSACTVRLDWYMCACLPFLNQTCGMLVSKLLA